ncbi:MAG TPA: metalloregulator ArsR/SmtB family transcription factor [Planctomycetota bacterium]|nr:metalloregulator ArsR/SmtB family transcription factor [Planctomycetota bacterium]
MTLEHETRRTIVCLLRDGEKSVGELARAFERPRPGVAHHLSVLLERGIVQTRVEGARRLYALDAERALVAWNALLRGQP